MTSRNLLAVTALLALGTTAAPAAFVINEVDSDTPGTDVAEFVELKGNPNESVAGLTLVFFNGNGAVSYYAVDLTGTADANGYYVVGNPGVNGAVITFDPGASGFLQNGEDAVALYSGNAASNFPNGTAPTATGLVDVIAYETGTDADGNWSGFGGTITVVDENAGGFGATRSLSRNPDGTGPFETLDPTPGAVNVAASGPGVATNVTSLNFGRYNAANTGSPANRTVRITNSGSGTLNVTTFGIQAGSAAQYTITTAPVPTIPAALTAGQSVEFVVSFENSATGTDQVFTGNIEYVTDAATNGSGTIPMTAEFVTVQQTAAAGAIVINEFAYDPAPPTPAAIQDYNGDGTGSTTQDEFFELYNTTASPINVQGWTITATSGSGPTVESVIVPAGVVVPANGHVVFFGGGTPTGFPANTAYVGIPALGNTGEQFVLSDGTTAIDQLSYLAEETAVGAPAGIGVTSDGGSVGRDFDGSATWIEFAFDSVTNPPTPGSSNGAAPLAATEWTIYN